MAEVTVWFDGACPLCSREIRILRSLDRKGRIAFVDVALAEAGCPIDRSELLARFHAREADGDVVSGAAAFAAMWRAIPPLRPLGLAMRWPPALCLAERIYLRWLRLRPLLQRSLAPRSPAP